MRRTLVFLLLVLLISPGCSSKESEPPRNAPSQKQSQPAAIQAKRSEPASPPLSATARETVTASYRLSPDRRFLLAVAEIPHLLTGRESPPAEAKFIDGRWQISCLGKVAALLPQYPDFPDFMEALQSWARTLHEEYPLNLADSSPEGIFTEIDGEIDQFFAPHAMKALRETDRTWREGDRDPRLLALATRSLTLLTLQGFDLLETGDRLPARALAVLALTKALTAARCLHEECLLAFRMDYSRHSIELSSQLPDTDPVRLFVTEENAALKDAAEREGAPPEARYLYLLKATELGDAEGLLTWIRGALRKNALALPVAKACVESRRFALIEEYSTLLPRLVVLDLARESGDTPDFAEVLSALDSFAGSGSTDAWSVRLDNVIWKMLEVFSASRSTLTERFESDVRTLATQLSGPFLDADIFDAYYRGYFYSALYVLGLHYLDSLSSEAAAERFANTLGGTSTGIGADLQRWYSILVRSKQGKGDPASLVAEMETRSRFGAPPFFRTLEEQGKYFAFGDPEFLRAVKRLAPHLDTRPHHLWKLGSLARSHLMDLKMAETITRNALRVSPSGDRGLTGWFAVFTADAPLLESYLALPHLQPELKSFTLRQCIRGNLLPPERIEREFKTLIDANPNNWEVREDYVKFLEKDGRYEDIRSVITDWLNRNVRTGGLERLFAQGALANAFYKEERYEEGWKVIAPLVEKQQTPALEAVATLLEKAGMTDEGRDKDAGKVVGPLVESQQAGIMKIAAMLLEKMGKPDEAKEMAANMVARYPDTLWCRVFEAGLSWRQGRYEDAAATLKSFPHKIGAIEFRRDIGREFLAAFGDLPKEKGIAAFSALLRSGFGHIELLGLAVELRKAGKSELAFDISSQLRGNGLENLVYIVDSYGSLKEWKGKDAALGWLARSIPPQMMNPSSIFFYREKEYDLLWDFIRNPEKGEHADCVWLMRAAASVRIGAEKDPHRQTLVDHYRNDPRGHYDVIGRFLLGLATESEALSLASDPKKLCETAYYVGLKCQGEGRYEDASDWYRVAIETGRIQDGEYRWAYDTLYLWYLEGKSLARLAAEGK